MMDYASLAQSGTDLTLGLLNMWFQQEANKEQRSFEQSQAATAYSYDMAMFNAANEYNTPANQMKRLQEAGLNPMLMYQRGDMGNTNATMPKYQQVKGQAIAPQMPRLNWLGLYQDVQMFKKDMDLKEELIKTQREEADAKRIENMSKVLYMFYDTGIYNYDELPLKYKSLLQEFKSSTDYPVHGGKGLKDYELDASRENVRRIQADVIDKTNAGIIKKWLGDWTRKKVETFDSEGMNIDKDAYIDRELNQLLGKAGVTGKYSSDIVKILMSLLRRK